MEDQPRGHQVDDHSEDNDPELDFLSSQFNPHKALLSKTEIATKHLPCPEVPPCDNLEHYLTIVKGRAKNKTNQTGRGTTGSHDNKNVTEIHTKMKDSQKVKTVLTFMKEKKEGPLRLLHDAYTKQDYIQVWIRHSRGLRGMCHGKLLAFDHHLNLVLSDVNEQYTPLKTVSNGGKGPKKRKKKKKQKCCDTTITVQQDSTIKPPITDSGVSQSEEPLSSIIKDNDTCSLSYSQLHTRKWACTKHVKQMFIRGDNIILIRPLLSSSSL